MYCRLFIKKYRNISGIYLIRNDINGKVYIGSSINVSYRVRQHLKIGSIRSIVRNESFYDSSYVPLSGNRILSINQERELRQIRINQSFTFKELCDYALDKFNTKISNGGMQYIIKRDD